ncbi:protein-L-isoaspartate O-methyltransferase [Patescibacteria group bacterium]|nr:protein-L-isoaspartate O-methyltransferase [Patescibacteria group bacterium]
MFKFKSNIDLINYLKNKKVLKTKDIIEAFEKVDRKEFVDKKYVNLAYMDVPLNIGYDVTISQPTTVAFMLELLEPKRGDKILDIGSGSGWTTGLLAQIIGSFGFVYGVEIIPELVKKGKNNLKRFDFKNYEILQTRQELGLIDKKPFNRILVSAASKTIPNILLEQLGKGGVLVLPVRNSILKISKNETGEVKIQEHYGFSFVPLIENQYQY